MIVWFPTVSAFVERVATPLEFSVEVPITVAPFLKVTVPVGMRPPDVTFAVKVTVWWNDDGFTDDVTVDDVFLLRTTCERAPDVLPAKFVAPL